jgi:sulfide:quinone oxidoreductase
VATRVLIAGGGVAALEAALALRALAAERVTIELLSPDPRFWYRPAATAESFGLGESKHFDLADLAHAAGATFSLGALARVEQERRVAHTVAGSAIPYDFLLVACGAVPTATLEGALTFRGPSDVVRVRELMAELDAGRIRRVSFAAPPGAVWTLPLYELALMTADRVAARDLREVELSLVTPEDAPLQVFGAAATTELQRLLDDHAIELRTGVYPKKLSGGELHLVPDGSIPVDAVVAVPRLSGPPIEGLPQTADGFFSVDPYGRVHGADDIFAAGDITTFPIKQGGIAAQQADAAAEMIAADVGAGVTPQPFRPVLRGVLVTGAEPRYLRHQPSGGLGETSAIADEPLWWPPAKVVGRYLAPFLADVVGDEAVSERQSLPG